MTDTTAPDAVLAAARDGDERAFAELVAPLRGELHAHCYRMLGSLHDAEDAVQDALLRAWRGLGRFEGRSSVRSWLYAIVTNAGLDAIARRGRRALPVDLGPSSDHARPDDRPRTDVAWLEPYPDHELADGPVSPHARYERRESVELAFVAALQRLPGNQRAALLLFDVLGFSAAEIAGMLETSPQSVRSALQRARATVDAQRDGPSQQQALRALGDPALRVLVDRYASALERGDADTLVSLLTADVSWAMPPLPAWYAGVDAVGDFLRRMPLQEQWRHLPVRACGQAAVACYRREPHEDDFTGFCLDVLTLRGDRVAGVMAFVGHDLFVRFGLPARLPAATPYTAVPS